jgi:hypothetical protein
LGADLCLFVFMASALMSLPFIIGELAA